MIRNTRAPALAVAAIALSAVATGCSGSSQQHATAPKPAGGSSGTRPTATLPSAPLAAPNLNVSEQQAEGILTSYQTANNQVNANRDGRLLTTIETDSALAMDSVGVKLSISEDPQNKNKTPPVDFTHRTYTIPRLTAYPIWFVAHPSINVAGNRQDATDLVFVQAAKGGPWRVAYEPDALMGQWDTASQLPPAVPTPAVAADQNGAAIALTSADSSSLVEDPAQLPQLIGMAQSVGQPAAHQAGEQFRTFGMLDTEKQGLANDKEHGQIDNEVPTMPAKLPAYPIYGVRTVDGGALVFVTTVNRWQYDIPPGGGMTLRGDIAALYGSTTARSSINVDYTEEFEVYVPAKGHGKLDVLQGIQRVTSVANQ